MVKKKELKVNEITSPEYNNNIELWKKFRSTYAGGAEFIDEYLSKFSARETSDDFVSRRKITYAPAHAKAAVNEIKNSIYQRMIDIIRKGGPKSYQTAIKGENGGVDLRGKSMDNFIGSEVLPELLSIEKVGVYIDKPRSEEGMTRRETSSSEFRPYLYVYYAEDIRAWAYDKNFNFSVLLLRDHIESTCDKYGLVNDEIEQYRLLTKLGDGGVSIEFFNNTGILTDSIILPLTEIPFVQFDISSSLLTDAADVQIAMLQLASADMNYAIKSNYPFYTEQYSPAADMGAYMRKAQAKGTTEVGVQDGDVFNAGEPATGTASEAAIAKTNEVTVGATKGRRYPDGLERPAFINPSSEPLKISMEKQVALKEEIRQLVNLNVSTLQPVKASAESKQEDNRGLEAGLSYIGSELAYGERLIAKIWSDYEKSKDIASIKYPRIYSLRTDEERRVEAKELTDLRASIPSLLFQKEMSKEIANTVIGNKVTDKQLETIHTEIDAADVIITDHETIRNDHEAGLVSSETASFTMGYPKGEVEKAKKDHAERLVRIKESQTNAAGARGIDDEDVDATLTAKGEKEVSQDVDVQVTSSKAVRGDAE